VFFRRVLKYERFDPPPVESLTSAASSSALTNLKAANDLFLNATPRRSESAALINEKSPGKGSFTLGKLLSCQKKTITTVTVALLALTPL
jgi:hypothetical protein